MTADDMAVFELALKRHDVAGCVMGAAKSGFDYLESRGEGGAVVILFSGGAAWLPSPDVTCVAINEDGVRCTRGVLFGRAWRRNGEGLAWLDPECEHRLLTQTCHAHEGGSAPQYGPVEVVFVFRGGQHLGGARE